MRKFLTSFASIVKELFKAINAGLDAGLDAGTPRPDKLVESKEKILCELKKKKGKGKGKE